MLHVSLSVSPQSRLHVWGVFWIQIASKTRLFHWWGSDVRTIFKSSGILRSVLTRVKTKTPELMKKGVVYKIPCRECETSYIGETGRTLQKRITEHKYAVKTNNRKNGIAVHAWDMCHQPDWEAAEVMETEPHQWKGRVSEAIWIQKTPQTYNLDCGLTLSDTWSMRTR